VTIRDFIAAELIDIIEWLDESGDTMVYRFSRPKQEIKNGAQLIVRPGQLALFVDQGKVADVFEPGRHRLTTANLPLLSTLRGWKYGFESPFKADVLFVSTTQFTNRKWGTSNPVIVRDPELGPVRLRAFGTYAVRVKRPEQFVREIVGTSSVFSVDEITEQLRDLVVARFSGVLAQGQTSVFALATQYAELGATVLDRVAAEFTQYGLELTQLVVENVSLPPEVESALDQRTRMNVIGDLDQYAKLQSADALRDAARNPSGAAAGGVGIAMGMAMGQRAMAGNGAQAAPAAPAAAEPPPLPLEEWYVVVDGKRRGPIGVATLADYAAKGIFTIETLVWRSGMAAWTRAADVPAMAGMLARRK
jgi:membrane protease subunit (stomatin/prohibitin family)